MGNTQYGIFSYEIMLTIHSNTTIITSVSYDFLANNFVLVLTDAVTDQLIATGDPEGSLFGDSYMNFENLLYADIPPGTYYLTISEDVSDKDLNFTTYCHRFEFFLAGFPSSEFTPNSTTIVDIAPPSGTNLNPFDDLVITISFSVAVQLPTGISVLNYIASNQAVYLLSVTDTSTTFPTSAFLDSSKVTLTLTWRAGTLSSLTIYFVAGLF